MWGNKGGRGRPYDGEVTLYFTFLWGAFIATDLCRRGADRLRRPAGELAKRIGQSFHGPRF